MNLKEIKQVSRTALLFLLIIFSTISCNRDKKVVINGTFSNSDNQTLYLSEFKLVSSRIIDSVKVKSDGKFKFKTKINEPAFYQISTDESNFLLLLAEPGDRIGVVANIQRLNSNYEIEGSKQSLEIKELTDHLNLTKSLLDSLTKIADKNEGMPGYEKLLLHLDSQYVEIVKAQRKYSIRFIIEHLTSLSSIVALYQQLDDQNYVLNQNRDVQYVKIVADSLNKYYPNSDIVKILNRDRNRLLTEFNKLKLSSVAKSAKVSNFPELALPSLNGDTSKLSKIQAKLILLNFWSPNNQESIIVLRSLKEIYPKYKKKGLEIYNVALMPNAEQWKAMVKKYDLAGIQVIDQSKDIPFSARMYNVAQLPATYLINNSGILSKDLFGENLDNKISELLR